MTASAQASVHSRLGLVPSAVGPLISVPTRWIRSSSAATVLTPRPPRAPPRRTSMSTGRLTMPGAALVTLTTVSTIRSRQSIQATPDPARAIEGVAV